MMDSLLEPIYDFLACETPQAWIDVALQNQDTMLIDHCNCEKKAANTAISLIFKYTERKELLMKMSKLAREELRHFEQVLQIMRKRNIDYIDISASRYASKLFKHCRKNEPDALVDRLIVGAFIEARSCERFAKIAPFLDQELGKFYLSLLKSESRHFKDYLKLASDYSSQDIAPRIELFRAAEEQLILSNDSEFRFHSGIPAAA
jgi:tRNA 2-(methylsulfanyl)-N6-isopentenyladenosine37 hydroxylase